MSTIANRIFAPGEAVGAVRESMRRIAMERRAPGSSHAGDLTPDEAWRLLAEDAEAVLVDVRTDAEWTFVGLPDLDALGKKPVLVCWQRFPDMARSRDFSAELSAADVTSATPLLFLCRSGARSASAAQHCAAQGYTDCFNIMEGFEGPPDGHGHRGRISGWKMRGLPWRQG